MYPPDGADGTETFSFAFVFPAKSFPPLPPPKKMMNLEKFIPTKGVMKHIPLRKKEKTRKKLEIL